MYEILPYRPGDSLTIVRELTRTERREIHAYFGRHDSPLPSVAASLHHSGNWIACDCAPAHDPPTIHTAANSRGTISLVRNIHRTNHAPGCPCATGLTDAYATATRIDTHLDATLLEATARAGTDRVWCVDTPEPRPGIVSALRLLADALPALPDTYGRAYTDRVSTHHAALPRLAVRLRQQEGVARHERQALLVFPATGHTRGGIRTWAGANAEGKTIEVRGPIHVRTETDIRAHLSLASAHISVGPDGRYEITDAHLYPVLDRGWPVITPTRMAQSFAIDMRALGRHLAEMGMPADIHLTYPWGLDAPAVARLRNRVGTEAAVASPSAERTPPAETAPDLHLEADRIVTWRPYALRDPATAKSEQYLPPIADRLFSLLARPRKAPA